MTGRESHPSTSKSSSRHLETERLAFSSSSSSSTSKAHDPVWVPAFHVVNFKSAAREDRNGDEEDYEGCGFLQQSVKKRRLSPRQVQFLERSFDDENKLEAEKKAQLAKELGLQPRQVAIWFQNRRARFKTKQLEKEYGELKESYDKLKAECDRFLKEKELLKEEVLSLKDKLVMRERRKETQNSSDPHPVEDQKLNVTTPKPTLGCKQEDTATASRNSSVLDSGSRYFTGSNRQQPLLLQPAGSSHFFEPDCSDFSQEEGGNLGFSGLQQSCGLGFMAELDQHLLSWP